MGGISWHLGLLQNPGRLEKIKATMNILIIGINDGSHMLAQLLLEYPNVTVYHVGANPNLTKTDRYIPLEKGIFNLIDTVKIDLFIPVSLIHLLWDELQNKIKEKNIPCLGPSKEIATLEWSRVSCKLLLKELEIPTPDYKVYNLEDLIEDFLNIKRPFVFKYDKDDRVGLQTVIVTDENYLEEYELLKTSGNKRVGLFKRVLGEDFNSTFIVEEFIYGTREYSYHAICNEVNWQYIGSARDYKKRFDGDIGFNTAGIGSYAGVETNPIVHNYVDRILAHLKEKGQLWIGVIYLGIMEDSKGIPHVLEINTRFGNPEAQVLLPLLNNNIRDLFYMTANNERIEPISFKNKSAVALRIIHKDYPNFPNKEITMPVLKENKDLYISYPKGRNLINSSIVTIDDSVSKASDKIYSYIKDIEMYDFTYRKDIGYLK